MEEVRILVTGSRHWTDYGSIKGAICNQILLLADGEDDNVTVIHGDCRGADKLAGSVAKHYGYCLDLYSVDHDIDGPWPGAGPRKNRRMFEASGPDIVLAFPLSPIGKGGTWDMVGVANKGGVEVVIIPAPNKE